LSGYPQEPQYEHVPSGEVGAGMFVCVVFAPIIYFVVAVIGNYGTDFNWGLFLFSPILGALAGACLGYLGTLPAEARNSRRRADYQAALARYEADQQQRKRRAMSEYSEAYKAYYPQWRQWRDNEDRLNALSDTNLRAKRDHKVRWDKMMEQAEAATHEFIAFCEQFVIEASVTHETTDLDVVADLFRQSFARHPSPPAKWGFLRLVNPDGLSSSRTNPAMLKAIADLLPPFPDPTLLDESKKINDLFTREVRPPRLPAPSNLLFDSNDAPIPPERVKF
jgi:hypothetical protein